MKQLLVFGFFLFITGITSVANNLSELYRQYLSLGGDQESIEIGNRIIQEASALGLINQIDAFKDHSEQMQALIHYAAAANAWEQHDLKSISSPVEKALALSTSLDDNVMQGDCWHLLGSMAQMQGDLYRAVDCFEKCFEADKKLGDLDRMSSSLNNLAGSYLSTNQLDEAEKVILRAIEMERNMGRSDKLAIRLGMASDVYLKLNKPLTALPYITEAFELDSLGGRQIKMAIRMSQRASVYEALERYSEARNSLLSAISILDGTNYIRSAAICYNQLGSLAIRENHNSQAVEYYGHALRLSRKCDDIYTESKAAKGLAASLRDTDPSKALRMLERHVELSDIIFSENTSTKLSQLQAKYNQAEREHEIEILNQRVKYKYLTIVVLCICLLALVVLCVAFIILLKKARNELKEISSSFRRNTADTQSTLEVHFTRREMDVIKLCCKGLQDKEIGNILHISERTVGTHKTNIFRKCSVKNTVELVNFANRHNLIVDEP